ncbi:MAG: protein kinase domain-containing protein, partial [Planctomycetota bacterium]
TGEISSTSEVIGTPFYMSPEQCKGAPVDGRSDLYSLRATAYHAVTGRPPVTGQNLLAVLRAHVELAPVLPKEIVPGISQTVSGIIVKLLDKSPDNRYDSASPCLTVVVVSRCVAGGRF